MLLTRCIVHDGRVVEACCASLHPHSLAAVLHGAIVMTAVVSYIHKSIKVLLVDMKIQRSATICNQVVAFNSPAQDTFFESLPSAGQARLLADLFPLSSR